MRQHTTYRLLAAMILFVLAALPGCGRGVGVVQGKVTYKGKPVSAGLAALLTSDNQVIQCPIQKDGSYIAQGVPLGPTRFVVLNPLPLLPAPGQPPPPIYTPLPKRFEKPDEVNLRLDVRSGSQTFDLDLK